MVASGHGQVMVSLVGKRMNEVFFKLELKKIGSKILWDLFLSLCGRV